MRRRAAVLAVAMTVAIAAAAAVAVIPSGGALTVAPLSRPAHTVQSGYWTRPEAAAVFVEAVRQVNQTALTDFARAWQMQAYWPTSHLRATIVAVAANDEVWAQTIEAGHWSPAVRSTAHAAVVEMRTWVAWWRAIAAEPTKAAINRAYVGRPPSWAAVIRLRTALGVTHY